MAFVRRSRFGRILAGIALAISAGAGCSRAASSAGAPVVQVSGPTVIQFYRLPASDDEAIGGTSPYAHALDMLTYQWAETYPALDSAGIDHAELASLRFEVEEPGRRWTFTASTDSGDMGYLFVQPGESSFAIYGHRDRQSVLDVARAQFGLREQY